MSKVACHYCGLPFKAFRVETGREYFCCSGCAIASRVPIDADGKFPANPTLLTAMAVGFVFFNQLMFWLLAILLVREGKTPAAVKFETISLTLAMVTWLALVLAQWRLGARRWVDGVVVVLTAGLVANGFWAGSPLCAALGNTAFMAWGARGFLKKKTPDKPVDGG